MHAPGRFIVAWSLGTTLLLAVTAQASAEIIDLEDLLLPKANTFYNGADGAGGFVSRGAVFNNRFTDFGGFTAWSGWSYSNVTDVSTPGFLNQYAAYHLPEGGGDASPNYAIGFAFHPGEAFILLPPETVPLSVRITNTTYAALSMLQGDEFAKRFGGESGDDPDFLLLSITGFDAFNQPTGTVEFYLADYRFDDNSLDYVVNSWTTVDLTSLGAATTLSFALSSSDVGPFGINTPTYVALDNLEMGSVVIEEVVASPEPGTVSLLGVGALALVVARARRRRGKTAIT